MALEHAFLAAGARKLRRAVSPAPPAARARQAHDERRVHAHRQCGNVAHAVSASTSKTSELNETRSAEIHERVAIEGHACMQVCTRQDGEKS